jgi:holo-[acyl-carrier protein] synthase
VILGVGIDLTPISRMQAALRRHDGRFEAKIFTPTERAYCLKQASAAQHYAARFAAKEAVVKAVPVLRGQAWHEVEVVNGPDGAPKIILHGAAELAARRSGVVRLHLSLTHAADHAAAVVVAEGP